MMNQKSVDEVNKVITQVVRSLDRNSIQYCKTYFEKNLLYLCKGELELKLIVDASAIIPEILAYIKTGKSFLLELTESPFFKICAPSWLMSELDKKIPEIASKKGLNENELRKIASMFLSKVEFIELQSEKAFQAAFAAVGYRDPKDVPYVAVYLSIKSHGIFTKDKDIIEAPEIKTWRRTGVAGRVVTVFEKGTFSFLILGKALPLTFRLLYEVCVTILRSIWEVTQIIGGAMLRLVGSGIEVLSKMPDWAKLIVGVGAILMLLWDKTRDAIVEAVKKFAQIIGDMVKWFYDSIKKLLEILAPVAGISITMISVLFQEIGETIDTYKQIESSQYSIL